jgi:hypothetical protein
MRRSGEAGGEPRRSFVPSCMKLRDAISMRNTITPVERQIEDEDDDEDEDDWLR